MNKIKITLVGNKGTLNGPPVLLNKMYEKFKIKHPNAWHAMRNSRGKWDGFIKYISQYGDFQIGLLPMILEGLRELDPKVKIKIEDERLALNIKPKLVTHVGKFELRDLQLQALKHFINNRLEGDPFYIGVINAATNFGKTLLMAAIHESFGRELRTLVLINNSQIFAQAKKEYKDYLPNEKIGFIQGKNLTFGNFNVGMVQTISQKVKELRNELSKVDIVLVDEADVADNKQFKVVLSYLYNTRIRLGLSGSIYMSKLKKDLVHNMNLRCFFGDELHVTTKSEMVKRGYSTPVIIKLVKGNDQRPTKVQQDWLTTFKERVIENPEHHRLSAERVLWNIQYNRLPAIVVTRFIPHSIELYKYYNTFPGLQRLTIYRIDHNTKPQEKKRIMDLFNKGKVDILIVTYIIKRGINLPTAVYMQNASGSDSEEDITQLCGRMERRTQGKSKSYLDDLYYYGPYIERHSKHRKNYYMRTGMKVINCLKKK